MSEIERERDARGHYRVFRAEQRSTPSLLETPAPEQALPAEDVQLLAWAVTNCHTLARRALARSTSVYDREKWEHALRICEKAGARSAGVLRASLPTEMTEGSGPAPEQEKPQMRDIEAISAQVHEQWMATKRSQGVTSRRSETGEELMVPYEILSEAAKELDRGSVRAVLDAIEALK